VGDTVRRPTGPHSDSIHRLLEHLEAAGVDTVPRFLGFDEAGREVLGFLEGWVPPDLEWRRWTDTQLAAAARIVREVHDATAGSNLAGFAEVVCHGDLSPCNFVFVDDVPHGLIDFDRAHPDTRKSDLAYMAWAWLIGREDDERAPLFDERLRQLGTLLDAYGLSERASFSTAIAVEQREILANHERFGRSAEADWVRAEIAFVEAHADAIDAAAA
jgi:aminoglycoside phosphotransferase (APT) family kinase protein